MLWAIYNFCDDEWWRKKKMATFERMLLARKHVIIGEKYNVVRKIGGGSFGDIFLAININDGEVNNWSKINFSIDVLSYITMSCQWCHVFREFCSWRWRSGRIPDVIFDCPFDIIHFVTHLWLRPSVWPLYVIGASVKKNAAMNRIVWKESFVIQFVSFIFIFSRISLPKLSFVLLFRDA